MWMPIMTTCKSKWDPRKKSNELYSLCNRAPATSLLSLLLLVSNSQTVILQGITTLTALPPPLFGLAIYEYIENVYWKDPFCCWQLVASSCFYCSCQMIPLLHRTSPGLLWAKGKENAGKFGKGLFELLSKVAKHSPGLQQRNCL